MVSFQQSLAPHALTWKNLSLEAYYSPARTIGETSE
jgi:hypothetical protein